MLARAQHYQHNEMQTRAGFLTLGSPDRCLEDRVHLTLDELACPLNMFESSFKTLHLLETGGPLGSAPFFFAPWGC
jgi:hypothetical protein